MLWKDYIQHNPLGEGDSYAWAYDEAVCAVAGNSKMPGHGYPWCKESQDSSQGAVDSNGNVRDFSCPCTVNNIVAPLGAIPFS